MPTSDGTGGGNSYAPYGICPKCGWQGRDWGFKYRNLCRRCHTKWRKARDGEWWRVKGLNETVEVAEGLVVTRNVYERLDIQAWSDIRDSGMLKWANWCEDLGLCLSLIAMFTLIFTAHFYPQYASLLIACAVIGYVAARVAGRVVRHEEVKRRPEVQVRLEELARKRQKEIDAARMFYVSPEWRILRKQVIAEQGRRCRQCGRHVPDDFDLTVDHIKPRSKFPELALDKSNLQVLCRQCNSSKGNTIPDGLRELSEPSEVVKGRC